MLTDHKGFKMKLKQVLYYLISYFHSLLTSFEVNIGQFLLLLLPFVKYDNPVRIGSGEEGMAGYEHPEGQ